MNIEQLFVLNENTYTLDWEDGTFLVDGESVRHPTESEVLGLAVQLLKQRGAEVRTTHKGNIGVKDWEPGRYLVVPLSALEGDNK